MGDSKQKGPHRIRLLFRWIFATMSVAMLLLSSGFWVRSYFCQDAFFYNTARYSKSTRFDRGITVSTSRLWLEMYFSVDDYEAEALGIDYTNKGWKVNPPHSVVFGGELILDLRRLGMVLSKDYVSMPGEIRKCYMVYISLPFLTVLFASNTLILFWRNYRRMKFKGPAFPV